MYIWRISQGGVSGNALSLAVVDKDGDQKVDFEEFVRFVQKQAVSE